MAEIEELPECSARGATPEEAVRRAWDAVESRDGQDQAQGSAGGRTRPAAAPRHSGKLLVRMPATLHDELARAAESEGVSLNQLITGALAGAVEWRTSSDRRVPGTKTVSSESDSPASVSGRVTRMALAANLVVLLVAAIVAITLLVVAWRDGF